MKLVKKKLENLGTIIGGATPSTKDENNYGGNIPWITPKDMTVLSSRYISKGERSITEKGFKTSSTFMLPKNSILFSSRAPIGYIAINTNEVCTNQGFKSIVPNKEIDYMYLYYVLKYNTGNIKNYGSGTTFKEVSGSLMKKIEITITENIIEQKRIAKMLSTLDDKIEKNIVTNNNLLDLINLNYSRYLNGLNQHEEINIKEIFDFETGFEPGSKYYSAIKGPEYIGFYRVGDMNSICKTYITKKLPKCKIVKENEILVSFDGTLGRIAYGINGAYSSGMKKVTINKRFSKELDNSIVFAYFNNQNIQEIISQNARGTTILHASSSIDFMKFKYNKLELNKYVTIISTLFKKMIEIKKEIEILTKLRDTLLPKLMNGEIDL